MQSKCILITGTPGTGKSTLMGSLTKALEKHGSVVRPLLINDLIKTAKLYDEYDSHFDTYIIDDKKVRKYLKKYLTDANDDLSGRSAPDFWILETHTVTTVPKDLPVLVVALNARTEVLYDRLVDRAYKIDKINENMECEIMRVVVDEATERFGEERVLQLPSNTNDDLNDNVAEIISHLFE